MKKRNVLPIISTLTLTTIPLVSIVGCSDKRTIVEQLTDLSIKKFYEICKVPHASYDLNKIREYVIREIKKVGINDYVQDKYGNLWYDVPASEGWEQVKPLVLQGHMDMVWTTADPESKMTHPIPLRTKVDGEDVIISKDRQSSLGADNGIGLGLMLALTINKNYKHGPIRCIFTADEEPGMVGASQIGQMPDGSTIVPVDHGQGFDYLINIDSEKEGTITVQCAGGYSARYTCTGFKTEKASERAFNIYKLEVTDMMGGHSGIVMDKNPVNGPKVVNEVMKSIKNNISGDPRYIDITTFEKAGNVVPKNTTLIFACNKSLQEMQPIINSVLSKIKTEHSEEKEIKMNCSALSSGEYDDMLSEKDTATMMTFIDNLHFGNAKDATDFRASANICPFELHLNIFDEQLSFMIFNRSENQQYLLEKYVAETAKFFGIATAAWNVQPTMEQKSYYPAYTYKKEDWIRGKVEEEYAKLSIEPKEDHIMGGIECAWWAKYNPFINQASIGPTIDDVHNINETLYVKTLPNLIDVLIFVIGQMQTIN